MKKRILKVVALAIAAFMVGGLSTACRNSHDYDIVIGMIAPLTGGASQFGTAVYRGVNLYIDQFNALGGLQIGVIVHDDEGTPVGAIAGYERLLDQNVTAIIGAVTSAPTMAIAPRSYEDGMPMITATATHANVTVSAEDGRVFTNMFRSCFIDPFQGRTMAEFSNEILEAQTFAILYANDIPYSVGLMQAFVERAAELGLTEVARERFADDAIDFRSQLTNISQASPDVLFIPAYYRHVMLIGPQSAEVGMGDTTLVGADGWATISDIMGDTSSIEGALFLTGFSIEADSPLVRDFVSSYRASHNNNNPNMFAAQAFDAAKILVSAILATIDATEYDADTDAFRAALISNMAATDLYGVTGRIIFDEFNNPEKTAIILEVRNGREAFWGYFPAE